MSKSAADQAVQLSKHPLVDNVLAEIADDGLRTLALDERGRATSSKEINRARAAGYVKFSK